MIPKVIHYCWVGGNPKPKSVQKCIDSWREKCPDYVIKEWNESNFDISINQYCQEAYSVGAWGFVPDYMRLWIIYNYGGIYLDTDVQLLKRLDPLLLNHGFCGMETEDYIALGLGFGAEKNNIIIGKMLEQYEKLHFINEDGSLNKKPSPQYSTDFFVENGFIRGQNVIQQIEDMTVYPTDYFCPKSFITGLTNITENSYSIHHYDSSWFTDEQQKNKKRRWKRNKMDYIRHFPNRLLMRILGTERYEIIKQKIKRKK